MFFWAFPLGRAFRCNLFLGKKPQKKFSLLSLTQNTVPISIQPKIAIYNLKSKVRYLWRFKKSFKKGFKEKRKKGKRPTSHRYNLIPLLRSRPGGFKGSWLCRTCPAQKYNHFFNFSTIFFLILV